MNLVQDGVGVSRKVSIGTGVPLRFYKKRVFSIFILSLAILCMLIGFQNCTLQQGFPARSSENEPRNCSGTCSDPVPTPTPSTSPSPNLQQFSFSLFGLSSIHRYQTGAVSGGWGAHLGHLLRSNLNQLWYVDDSGNDSHVNAGLVYYRFVNGIWTGTAVASFPGTVQQNTGSLISGSMIFSYGMDVQNNKLVECYFETSDPSFTTHACNHLAFDTGADSNYIGATISKGGTRVVWWTNTAGTFSYIYNFGGGWNGPITNSLGGYVDFSYVYARLADDNSQIEFLGAAARAHGGASVGYDVLFASTNLGTLPSNWTLLFSGGIGMETWKDPNGGTHFFTYGSATPMYFYKPSGGALTSQPALPDGGIVGARIVQTASTANLVMSFADGHVKYKTIQLSEINGPINWSGLSSYEIPIPSGLGVITLFPESSMYQTTQPQEMNIVINGSSQEALLYMIQGK